MLGGALTSGRGWASACALAVLATAVPAAATQPLAAFLEQAEKQSFDAREARANEQQRRAEADGALARLLRSLSARGVFTRNQSETAVAPQQGSRIVITPFNQLDAIWQLDVPIIDLPNHHRYHSASALVE